MSNLSRRIEEIEREIKKYDLRKTKGESTGETIIRGVYGLKKLPLLKAKLQLLKELSSEIEKKIKELKNFIMKKVDLEDKDKQYHQIINKIDEVFGGEDETY